MNNSEAQAVQAGQGMFVTGEFRSLKEGRVREGKNGGKDRTPVLVKVLSDDIVHTVEYWDRAAVEGTLAAAAEPGDVITLPIYARAAGDRVYLRGLSNGRE
jgi:hypothetical protein